MQEDILALAMEVLEDQECQLELYLEEIKQQNKAFV